MGFLVNQLFYTERDTKQGNVKQALFFNLLKSIWAHSGTDLKPGKPIKNRLNSLKKTTTSANSPVAAKFWGILGQMKEFLVECFELKFYF